MRCAASWPSCLPPPRCFLALGQLVAGQPRRSERGRRAEHVRYAIFPSTRRLAIQIDGVTRIFDTGEHQIGGVQQQQGGGACNNSSRAAVACNNSSQAAIRLGDFTSQFGTFDVSSLTELGTQQVAETPARGTRPAPAQYRSEPAPQVAPQTRAPEPASGASGDPAAIVAAIESLAGLHQRGILSDEEFATKKAELLGRL